jgi:hydroxymethylglutaryl-CoA reductase
VYLCEKLRVPLWYQKENMDEIVKHFSKLDRAGRIEKLEQALGMPISDELDLFLHNDAELQLLFSELSENYLSNYYLPFGIVPNVRVNNRLYFVPVVIEESSVVAAASRSSRFWAENGGFRTEIVGTEKKGQVHFIWHGHPANLKANFPHLKEKLLADTHQLTEGMRQRGGGITSIELVDRSEKIPNYFQLDVSFETADAMGANFINSCLEQMGATLADFFNNSADQPEVLLSILSNYTPHCAVKCWVECPIEKLSAMSGSYTPEEFVHRFQLAVQMANADVSRAVTHNKGIYNGVDAVVLATGNDWRAVEAAGHAFASQSGNYRSLSDVAIANGIFRYELTLPLAIGTVGGLTKTHPLAKLAMKMLGEPSSEELMAIVAAVGMANNFSAVASLVTSGIQKGHMKMHLSNILNQLNANEIQKQQAIDYFSNKTVSYSAVQAFLNRQ